MTDQSEETVRGIKTPGLNNRENYVLNMIGLIIFGSVFSDLNKA